MKYIAPKFLAAALVFLVLPSWTWADAADIPQSVFGVYKAPVRTCFVGPRDVNGKITWQDCTDKIDILAVSPNIIQNGANDSPARLSLEFNFTNAHQCVFEGSAYWRRDRLVAIDDESPDCKLTIFFFGRAAHVVAQACESRCGARGQIDGAILSR